MLYPPTLSLSCWLRLRLSLFSEPCYGSPGAVFTAVTPDHDLVARSNTYCESTGATPQIFN